MAKSKAKKQAVEQKTNSPIRQKTGEVKTSPAPKPKRWQCSNGAIYSNRQAAEEYQRNINPRQEIKEV